MRRIVGNNVWLLLIYVDDILVIADKAKIERLRQRFTEEYTWITMDGGSKHLYLGMQICLEDGYVNIIHYIAKMLENVENLEESGVPANQKSLWLMRDCTPRDISHKWFSVYLHY